MRVGVIRIVRDGLKYFFFCFSEPALLARGNAKIIVGNWVFRIDLERLGQFGEGVIKFGLPIIDDAQSRMYKLVLGRDGQGLFQCRFGRLKSAAANINGAEIGKRVEIIRSFVEDFLVLAFGGTVFAMLEALFRRARYI